MTTQILKLKTLHTVRLLHLDGTEWQKQTFTDVRDAWSWVQHVVAAQLEVDPANIDSFASPEGDMATLDGIPVCWIVHGLPFN